MASPSPPTPTTSTTSRYHAITPFSSTTPSRLQSLYSDFPRQRQSNPVAYSSNVEWWKTALESIVSSGLQPGDQDTRLVLYASPSLLDSLKVPKVGKPLAIGAVISELQSSRSLFPLSNFLSPSRPSIYDHGSLPGRIAAYVVGKPLWWALEQLGVVGDEGIFTLSKAQMQWQGTYVVVSLLEQAAETILEKHQQRMTSPSDALYTRMEFRRTFSLTDREVLDETDTKVLLQFLSVDRREVVIDGDVVKFVGADSSHDERTITAVDKGIVELKGGLHNLRTQVDTLQQRIDECTSKATDAVRQKHKAVALSYLQSKKRLETLLTERLGSLHTLESTFMAVESAASNVEIMKSYQSSTATLKAILAHPLLERTNIDDTMDALAEANADAKDISSAINIGADLATGVTEIDDADIEEELRQMTQEAEDVTKVVKAEQEAEAVRRKLAYIEIPDTPPERLPPSKQEVATPSLT